MILSISVLLIVYTGPSKFECFLYFTLSILTSIIFDKIESVLDALKITSWEYPNKLVKIKRIKSLFKFYSINV